MVRGITGVGSNSLNRTVLNGIKASKTTSAAQGKMGNATKHIDLPAKIALGLMGFYGTDKVISEPSSNNAFLMKCSEYEGGDDGCINSSYFSYPYPD